MSYRTYYFEFEEDTFYPKRVQVDPTEPHKKAATRKASADRQRIGIYLHEHRQDLAKLGKIGK